MSLRQVSRDGSHGPLSVVPWRDSARVAAVRTTLRDVDVIAENVSAVLALFERAGVRHFLVPVSAPGRVRFGVSRDDRQRLAQAVLDDPSPPGHRYLHPSRSPAKAARPLASTRRPRWEQAAMSSTAWTMFHCYVASGDGLVGDELGCEIEFWRPRRIVSETEPQLGDSNGSTAEEEDGTVDGVSIDAVADEPDETVVANHEVLLVARRRNPVGHIVNPADDDKVTVDVAGRTVRTHREFAAYFRHHRRHEPIDVVYTWVDDGDPTWQQRRADALEAATGMSLDAAGPERYANRDELRYSLRSLHQHADFVRHIYLVTDQQVPAWLASSPDLTVIDHREIFAHETVLPVFNSHAIESQLHHIEGLSEHYLYINDDVFFGRHVHPALFFSATGQSHFFPSRARVPIGPVTLEEPAVTSAGKNGRDLIADAMGYPAVHKFKHTPHPQRRSVLVEMEQRFGARFARVAAQRFRSHADVSIASSLHHHYGHATGSATPGVIRYQYVNLAADRLGERLGKLIDGRYDTFCLNDIDVGPDQAESVARALTTFLRTAFPYVSPFERSP